MNIVSICILSFSLGVLVCNLIWVVLLNKDKKNNVRNHKRRN